VEGLDPTEGAHEQAEVDDELSKILGEYLVETRQKMERLGRSDMQKIGVNLDEHEWRDAVAALTERWRQIEEMLDKGYQLVQSIIQRK